MKLKLINETESKLFNRKTLTYEATFEGSTPKKDEIKKSIATSTKAKEELIIIEKVKQKYGTTKAEIKTKLYSSPETLKLAETRNKKPKKKKEKK